VLRDGKEKTFTLTVTELTEERQASEAKEEGGAEKNPLGLLVKNINPELARRFHLRDTKGVLVEGVEPGSAAADAGIQPGDIVMEIDNQAINTVKDFQTAVDRLKKENFVRLLIKRQGRTQYLTLEVPK
jgi:serine protease Do